MSSDTDVSVPYWPRVVPIGILAAGLALVGLSVVLFVSDDPGIRWGAFVATLAILAFVAGFLSRELARRTRVEKQARVRSGRWASLLSTVATAGRGMTLDPNGVADVVVDAIIGLGFDGAGLCALEEDARRYHVVRTRELPAEYAAGAHPASTGVIGLVLRAGETVVINAGTNGGRPTPSEAVASLPAGFRTMVGTPVWVGGWLAAVLIGASRREREIAAEVEALELLAAQAGLALENARSYEEERQTVERLEEIDRLKSDFLASVSHELRTPITVIQGSGITLEEHWESLDDNARLGMVAAMNASARTLDEIIATLLDFSRLESGYRDTTPEPTDLSGLLLAAAERLREPLADHRFAVEVDPGLTVDARAVLLGRVVDNLLSNAAKHTAAGTEVTLSAHREGPDVVVAVADDGPGISEQELVFLGERFYRAGDVNARPKGLGLGLALVREALRLHGSELEIESRKGEGSRFSFRLRARTESEGSIADAAGRVPAEPDIKKR